MKSVYPFLLALAIVLISITLLLSPFIINYDKTAKNTVLLGHDYSSLNRQQIYDRLDGDFVLPQTLDFEFENKISSVSLASISAQIDKSKTAGNMLYRRLNEGVLPYIKYFFQRKDFNLVINIDENSLNQVIENLSTNIDKPYVPDKISLNSGKVVFTPGQIGRSLDRPELKSIIIESLAGGQWSEVLPLPVVVLGKTASDSEISDTKKRAEKLIGHQLVLNGENQKLEIDDKTLIGWLDLTSGVDRNVIAEYVNDLSSTLKRDPIDAVFKFENNKVTEFRPAADGLELDKGSLVESIVRSYNEISNEKIASIDIPFVRTPPKIKTQDVNDLGIKELLGRGTSTFKHSSDIRNHNISQGSSMVNRILVAPNDTFSFVKALGNVSIETGYKMAYVIRAGKTELDVGGGICQVSTTFFRAMLNAGLDITERRNHAYRVSYYEEDMPPGYDATVFIPSPDLKFVNDTGHYLLIQNTLDLKTKQLTYEIYGTSDGRKAEIGNYRQWDARPAPPDVFIDDPTLPQGKVIKEESRVPGLKTSFDWKVTRQGEVIHQKTFTSSYTPWAAVYRRGTMPPQ